MYEENWGTQVLVRRPGSLALTASGAVHSNRIHSTGIRFFTVELTEPWVERANGHLQPQTGFVQFEGGPLPWLARRLYREFKSPDDLSPLAIEGLALELLAGVARHNTSFSERGNSDWLRKAKALVRERFRESISLAEVAQFAGVHPVSLARAFRRTYHCSVGEYVRQVRIEFACQQLAASNAPLVEIAFSAGFSEQSHFCRTFKRLTGLTPSQYRSHSR